MLDPTESVLTHFRYLDEDFVFLTTTHNTIAQDWDCCYGLIYQVLKAQKGPTILDAASGLYIHFNFGDMFCDA
jgi:hypothetical protein